MGMHIGHVALRSTDVAGTAQYLERVLQLRVSSRDGDTAFLSANDKHHEVQLIAGDSAGIDHVGLEVDTVEDLAAVKAKVLEAGAPLAAAGDGQAQKLGESFQFVGPGDLLHEVYVNMERKPLSPAAHLGTGVRRLGHLTFYCVDYAAFRDFWIDVLGFRISDSTPDGTTWLRCDADHHGLAVAPRAEGQVLHHHAWEVQDLSALGKELDRLGLGGETILWGPVRHGPGQNISVYMLAPDGVLIELYCDLLRIDADDAYVPVDWSGVPGALNLWGPPPPPALLTAGVPIVSSGVR